VISKERERGGSFTPELVGLAEVAGVEYATRAAGVLAGVAVGAGLPPGELRTALAVLGLDGISPDREVRKAVTAGLDEEWRRLHGDAA